MMSFLLIINCYICIHIFQLFQSLDGILSCDDIEGIATTSHKQTSQTEDIHGKLTIWKPRHGRLAEGNRESSYRTMGRHLFWINQYHILPLALI